MMYSFPQAIKSRINKIKRTRINSKILNNQNINKINLKNTPILVTIKIKISNAPAIKTKIKMNKKRKNRKKNINCKKREKKIVQ